MISNISSLSSEFIIINYIFSDLDLSNDIFNILKKEDFFFETTKKYFIEKKCFYKLKFVNENIIISNLKNIINKSKKRKMLKILFNISFELILNDEVDNEIFEKIIFLLNFKNNNYYVKNNYLQLLKNFFLKIEDNLYTGYYKLDNLINGLQKGNFIVLAGRPSTGKTSFFLNIIKNFVFTKKKILIFSLEMTETQILIRLISIMLNINQNNFLKNNFSNIDIKKISFLIKNLDFNNLIIKDCSYLSSNDVEKQINFYKQQNIKIELIIIDYIQLMKSEYYLNNRVLEISEISRSLKLIAKNYECVVIALSQLNRLIEQRIEKIPMLSDLKDSGSIEQDADIVMFLNKKKFNFIDLLILKNRNGELGIVNFIFKNEYTKFLQI
ncbi:MAG: DnaB-like helicase C-terminal domain-containing protein [Candidatus Carsonella ruddii]